MHTCATGVLSRLRKPLKQLEATYLKVKVASQQRFGAAKRSRYNILLSPLGSILYILTEMESKSFLVNPLSFAIAIKYTRTPVKTAIKVSTKLPAYLEKISGNDRNGI